MSKKGFTLVELLAVLVLLSVIVLVAFPNILGAIKKTDDQISSAARTLLETNARSYVTENSDAQTENCVTVKKLINEGYTKTPIASVSEETGKTIEENWGVKYSCTNGICNSFAISETGC